MARMADTERPDEGKGKIKTVNLRPVDLERLRIAKERTGIESETDVLRFVLADYVNRTNTIRAPEPPDHAAEAVPPGCGGGAL